MMQLKKSISNVVKIISFSSLIILIICCISLKINAQKNITLLGTFPYSQNIYGICGYVDTLGNEYAVIGTDSGISIIDVTIPSSPVSVFFFPDTSSWWRAVETYNNYAYITNETWGGLLIIDLSTLPFDTNLSTSYFTGGSYPFQIAHELFIDKNGICYLFGTNYGNGGAIMLDLTSNPTNPAEVGIFDMYYFHDGMTRGDTLWGAAIYNGFFSVIDISNKSSPVLMANQNTPHFYTHQCWISDDGNTLFTTDQISGAFITSFNISDLGNITELDKIQSNPGSGAVPYDTYVIGNFLVNSYNKDGVTIVDATRPTHLIEVGYYDTYPSGSGDGLTGCKGVYPYLPSGNIIATDMINGLFILDPNYVRACYLEGIVTDSSTGTPIINVIIEILSISTTSNSNIIGEYKIGTADSGTYTIQFSKVGYFTKTISGINLSNGIVTYLNVELTDSTNISINKIIAYKNNFMKIYPNPFNQKVNISYSLAAQSELIINIYNPLGKKVKELIRQNQQAGNYEIIWDAKDFPHGIYFYELNVITTTGNQTTFKQVNKLLLVE